MPYSSRGRGFAHNSNTSPRASSSATDEPPSTSTAGQKRDILRREPQPSSSSSGSVQPPAAQAASRQLRPSDARKYVEVLEMPDLSGADPTAFTDFDRLPQNLNAKFDCTLARALKPSPLELWCSGLGRGIYAAGRVAWDPERGSPALRSLGLLPFRRSIVEAIHKNHVTVVIAPTGSGKSLAGPMFLAELQQLQAREGGEASKALSYGLTLCPSGSHATNTVKECEKMYMTSKAAYCNIKNYINAYDPAECFLAEKDRADPVIGAPLHAIATNRGVLNWLSGAPNVCLDMLVVDEAHSTAPEFNLELTTVRDLLVSGRVRKLVLTTATLEPADQQFMSSFFAELNLTMTVIDLTEQFTRKNKITMSCVHIVKGQNLEQFEETRLSRQLTADFAELKKHLPVEGEPKLKRFGREETNRTPEMNHMAPYFKQALDRATEFCTMIMEKELSEGRNPAEVAMPSILAILPGKEHIDRVQGGFWVHFVNGRAYCEYKHFLYKDTGKPAFIIKSLKSSKATAKKKKKKTENDEELDEDQELPADQQSSVMKKKEELSRGPWGGPMGTITFATPAAAEGMTLEDVAFVIDSGVQRIASRYSPAGLRSLVLYWIDRSMLYQRAGRCGRTRDGEYFLCCSGAKTEHILHPISNLRGLLLERNFDELSWLRAKQMRLFDRLFFTPSDHLISQFEKSFEIRGAWLNGDFTREAKLLYSYMSFLAPEHARFVVLGVRLGIAAHVICYVAEAIVSNKLCGRPTKIAANYETVGEEKAYDSYVNVCALMSVVDSDEKIRPYDMGDSVAKADMVVTWLRTTFHVNNVEVEPNFDKYDAYNDAKWKELETTAFDRPDGRFWSGRWCTNKKDKADEPIGMKKLQEVFIREDGREAVCDAVGQISRACQRLGLIEMMPGNFWRRADKEEDNDNHRIHRGSFLAPRYNRYCRGEQNYNLNEDGRALFRALLTMCSDKVARAHWRQFRDGKTQELVTTFDRFEVYVDINDKNCERNYIFPDRMDWKEREHSSTAQLVRYWSAFKATHGDTYIGSLDPITTAQAAHFINICGVASKEKKGLKVSLNAGPSGHRDGVVIDMGREEPAEQAWKIREKIKTAIAIMLRSRANEFEERFAFGRALIRLWQACDDGAESRIKILPSWEEKKQLDILDLVYGGGVRIPGTYSDFIPKDC